MNLNFTVRFKPITLESLTNTLSDLHTYPEDEPPIEDAKKYLSFFQELVSVLSKDEEYLCDFKKSLLVDVFDQGYIDNYNEDDFATLCDDERITRFYLEKHFDELSESAKELYEEFGEDEFFLSHVEYHAVLEYEVIAGCK